MICHLRVDAETSKIFTRRNAGHVLAWPHSRGGLGDCPRLDRRNSVLALIIRTPVGIASARQRVGHHQCGPASRGRRITENVLPDRLAPSPLAAILGLAGLPALGNVSSACAVTSTSSMTYHRCDLHHCIEASNGSANFSYGHLQSPPLK